MKTFKHIVREYAVPMALGIIIAGSMLYMVMDPSGCRWEEVC